MTSNTIKDWFTTISNLIDDKLKTPTGRLTLIILTCIILGGTAVHSYNISSSLEVITKEKREQTRKADSIQNSLNRYIENRDADCNKKLEEGALLQQRMKAIYNQQEEDNLRIAKENEKILKEREATAKAKLENIKALNNLKNQ